MVSRGISSSEACHLHSSDRSSGRNMDLAFENLHLTSINNNFSSSKVHITVDVNIVNVLGSHRI